MPQFEPQFAPENLDEFTTDYLIAAEWLLDDEEDRDAIKGWAQSAIEEARRACQRFQEENTDDLAAYQRETGYTGGNDFWLTRNRHGAGFWDRGLGETGKRLTKAADVHGERDAYRGDDGFLYFA